MAPRKSSKNHPTIIHGAAGLQVIEGGKLSADSPALQQQAGTIVDEGTIQHNPRTEASVFKDGTVIVLEGMKACPGKNCQGQYKPMADFGFRKMKQPNGTEIIRSQSYCKDCR